MRITQAIIRFSTRPTRGALQGLVLARCLAAVAAGTVGCPTSPRHRLVSVTLTASRTPGPECPRYDHTVEDTGVK